VTGESAQIRHGDLVVVAGGAGYLGCVLVPWLLSSGYRVRVLDCLVFGARGLDGVRDAIELVDDDICSVSSDALRGAKALINLAAISNDPTADFRPALCRQVNLEGALRLAELCLRENVSRYIFASSCSVYDSRDPHSTPRLHREEDMAHPIGPYSQTKYQAETDLLKLASPSFCPVSLRKGTLYGFSPRMRFDLVVNTFVRDALERGHITLHGGGTMWRPLLHVVDAAEAYVACLTTGAERISGQAFNVLHRNLRIDDVSRQVCQSLAQRSIHAREVHAPGPAVARSYRADGGKAQRFLGFQAARSIASTVSVMVDEIEERGYTDFDNPWYSNIQWMDRAIPLQK
jgi:nucleoside-diphosphate-sugar epimerase